MAFEQIHETIVEDDKIVSISDAAFRLWVHLLIISDDYGRFPYHTELILSRCFPKRPKAWKKSKVATHLCNLEKIKLLKVYEVKGKKYFELNNYQQWKKNRKDYKLKTLYPAPPERDLFEGCYPPFIPSDEGVTGENENSTANPKENPNPKYTQKEKEKPKGKGPGFSPPGKGNSGPGNGMAKSTLSAIVNSHYDDANDLAFALKPMGKNIDIIKAYLLDSITKDDPKGWLIHVLSNGKHPPSPKSLGKVRLARMKTAN